jgi:RNA polymerase sigma-70 factor (ECF subfamily)
MTELEEKTDEELVEIIRSADRELFSVIIDRYEKKLFRYAYNLIKNESKAADIVQEAFIKSFINLKGFDAKKKFSSWIYRIVHNEAMNSVKKYRQEVPILDDMDFQSNENIEKDFEKKEIGEEVARCMDQLPIIYAEPLALYYYEDKTYDEISDILHIPPGTVAIRIKRSKIIMKKICQTKK